jgi:RimJ/RimL family protein N-acetyltransferase
MSRTDSLRPPPNEIIYKSNDISLLIKPLDEKNAEDIFTAVRATIDNLLPFMDWAHYENSIEGQRERLKKTREEYFQGKEYELAVFDHKTGEFLMASGWHKGKNRNNKSLEIGYWTCLKHCNKGLATMVTQILVVVGFDFMGSDRIEVGCNKQNVASRRVIEKCGFKFEGEISNYFNEPTAQMIQNGYSTERTYLQYVLLPKDRENLAWYEAIKEKIEVGYFQS